MNATATAKFSTGQTVATPNALGKVHPEDILICMNRHIKGDWGNLDKHDTKANEDALKYGNRILSSYLDRNNVKFWIITEADRSSTCILLPEDY